MQHISGYKVKQKGHAEHLLDTPDPDDDDGDGGGEDEDYCDPHRLVKRRCLNLWLSSCSLIWKTLIETQCQ